MTDAHSEPGVEQEYVATSLEVATAMFDGAVEALLSELHANFPQAPMSALGAMATSRLMAVLVGHAMKDGKEASGDAKRKVAQSALLFAYEQTFERPMTFIERNTARDHLQQLSNARRASEAAQGIAPKPEIIIPNGA